MKKKSLILQYDLLDIPVEVCFTRMCCKHFMQVSHRNLSKTILLLFHSSHCDVVH